MSVKKARASRPAHLTRPVDHERDHMLGGASAEFTLVEYGSYACTHCHAAHGVVQALRERFGDRLRYVFRHLPLADRDMATAAAELVEYAAAADGRFWDAHNALMDRSPRFTADDLEALAEELHLPPKAARRADMLAAAHERVREDALNGIASGARVTPTFFINGRRYEGAWDESALAEALVGGPGQRLAVASRDFMRWAPATGLLLLLATVSALVLSNTGLGAAFADFWRTQLGLSAGAWSFSLSLFNWVNHGLLTVFFLVVGLEIKHEFTVGRLASVRAATLPVVAAFGGMLAPALIYLAIVPAGPLTHGWGLTIATDTAFAVALIVLLGDRVPADLRVFLTAAVIVDDLVAIALVAVLYTESISLPLLGAAALLTLLLALLNRWNIYRPLPYIVLGALLWFCLHEAGIHATLAGVILALVVPTMPPPNLKALNAQAQLVFDTDRRRADGTANAELSPQALRAMDAIHQRIESPASKVLRAAMPWSNFFVLPLFALANADLVWSSGILDGGHLRFALGIMLGLMLGKPLGIVTASWIAVRLGIAAKPEAYSWYQLLGAGTLAGIGFTMSLFIAGQAFPDEADFRAAKLAIFMASFFAATLGVTLLRLRRKAA